MTGPKRLQGLLSQFRKRLGRKILITLAASVALVMGTEIYVRMSSGMRDRIRMTSRFASELAASTYAGIKYPMSIGDSDFIRQQLRDIREKMEGGYVFISDYNQEIVYSTHEEKVRTKVGDVIRSPEALRSLGDILSSGAPAGRAFSDEVNGSRFLITMHPIPNEPVCHHCHGASRKVLGSMIIMMNTDETHAAIVANARRSILISLFGIGAIIALTYAMLSRFVTRPIESLAGSARRFAEGDMTVTADVKSEDEIGVLSRTFNDMVRKIASFSRDLETEVARRTMMLREKTLLLERANRELRELDRLKSAFLANMSHELRTPMNSIIGYTELLIDGVDGEVNDEQLKSLRKVENNARHLLQLINDILDMSKIEAGKIELDIRELNARQLIEAVSATFEPAVAKKGLSLSLQFEDDLPPIFADEDKVRQILINLLSNAIKFTHQGGIRVTAQRSGRGIGRGEAALFLEICVEDTGIGIRDDDIGKLFDKFSQLDISSIRQYEGTGLGLSIARGLVVLHKGVIWVTSRPGHGSRFCFTLPVTADILAKPARLIIEQSMAEGLSRYFNKPADIFLRQPEYAGKPVKCWEYVHCGQTSCPAYGADEHRCWLIFGTHCKGVKISAYPEKVDFCKGCEVIERLILESDEFTDFKRLEAGETAVEAGKKTVLVIDDNMEAVEIIRKYLGPEYRVVGLLEGADAVSRARELKPVAITLDIMMPRKDGWTVLQELKSTPETQDIPVIIVSIVDDKKQGFSLGAAEYIVKPVDREILMKKLRSLQSGRRIRRVLVADSDRETVDLVLHALTDAGCQPLSAATAEEAVRLIRDTAPDLIIVNVTMEGTKGFDVIEYLKSDEKASSIPLIVLTKKGLSQEEREQLNGRIQGILNKGVLSEEELLTELVVLISASSGEQGAGSSRAARGNGKERSS